MRRVLVSSAVSLVLAACGERSESGTVGAPGEARVSPGFDLNAVVSQVRHAFREDEAGFTGGSDTYAVQVTTDGRAALTPLRWESSPSGPRVPRAGAPVRLETVAIGRDVEALDC